MIKTPSLSSVSRSNEQSPPHHKAWMEAAPELMSCTNLQDWSSQNLNTRPQIPRMTEWLRLEGSTVGHLVPLPAQTGQETKYVKCDLKLPVNFKGKCLKYQCGHNLLWKVSDVTDFSCYLMIRFYFHHLL